MNVLFGIRMRRFLIILSPLTMVVGCNSQFVPMQSVELKSSCQNKTYQQSTDISKTHSLKGVFKSANAITELTLRVSTSCILEQSGRWSVQFKDQIIERLPSQIISYSTTDFGDVEEEVLSDPCVLGVYPASQRFYKASQSQEVVWPLPDDPFADEAYFAVMGLHRGQLRLFHPIHGIKTKVPVAILDTGVDYNHEDLRNVMWDDGNGNVGIRTSDGALNPIDTNSHGTHVAGIVGADTNNGTGVQSIGRNIVEIMAINASLPGSAGVFAVQDIIEGIDYAIANNAKVINMSLGSMSNTALTAERGPEALERDAIMRAVNAGIIVVAAAGNENVDARNSFPAGFNQIFEGVISVGSIDINGQKSSFSNFSSTVVDILATGNEIGGGRGRAILSTIPQNQYERFGGTSMAAPVVTAAFALAIGFLETHNIEYTTPMLEEIVLDNSRRDPALSQASRGGRVLDLDLMSKKLYEIAGINEDPVEDFVTMKPDSENPSSIDPLIPDNLENNINDPSGQNFTESCL